LHDSAPIAKTARQADLTLKIGPRSFRLPIVLRRRRHALIFRPRNVYGRNRFSRVKSDSLVRSGAVAVCGRAAGRLGEVGKREQADVSNDFYKSLVNNDRKEKPSISFNVRVSSQFIIRTHTRLRIGDKTYRTTLSTSRRDRFAVRSVGRFSTPAHVQ